MENEYYDINYVEEEFKLCCTCENAKFKEHSKCGDIFYCYETRQYITENSIDWMCRRSKGHSLYEKRKN